jgi:hypothetical protein
MYIYIHLYTHAYAYAGVVGQQCIRDFIKELHTMTQLRHPNVVLFMGACLGTCVLVCVCVYVCVCFMGVIVLFELYPHVQTPHINHSHIHKPPPHINYTQYTHTDTHTHIHTPILTQRRTI